MHIAPIDLAWLVYFNFLLVMYCALCIVLLIDGDRLHGSTLPCITLF
jgi:hypothetical protein